MTNTAAFSPVFDDMYFNNRGHAFYIVERNVESKPTKHRIRFINSGFEALATMTNIRNGKVKDYMEPHLWGVGYLGASPDSFFFLQREYKLWNDLLFRVTNNKSYKDVIVCSRWYCFKSFVEDVRSLPNYDKWVSEKGWQIDKDELSKRLGFAVYSPQTCQFITAEANNELMQWSRKLKAAFNKAVDIRELKTDNA
ncbi:TPA: hypothetical protein ACGCAO_003933 [Enterobacter cloacae]